MDKEDGSLWSIVWTVFGILSSFLVVKLCKKSYRGLRYFEEHNVPHRKPLPILGNTLAVLRRKTSFPTLISDMYTEFSDAKYFGVFVFAERVYVLRDPEFIKSITIKNFDHFPDHRGFVDESIDPLFGGNLFFMTGERWKEMRSIISPVFTSSKMKAMFELVSECADDFTRYLEKQPQPLTLEMKDILTRYTNDVIATAAFGLNVNSLENRENEFYMMGKDATNFRGLRTIKILLFRSNPKLMRFFRFKFLSTKVSTFFRNLISDTISTRERNGITRPDLIHQLMQARHKPSDTKLTIDEITAQAFIFFFAGFDTSSTLMCFACHQLAVHQEMQERLVHEIDAAFEEEKGDKLSYEKVNHMQYLEMFLNETLRFYPPTTFVDRVSAHDFEFPPATETVKPNPVKPGTRLLLPIHALHHDPKYFPNPEKFDPERFSPENKDNIKQFTFIPFGAGPRSCPGNRFALMETKLMLCSVLRKFRIEISAKTHLPLVVDNNSPAITAKHGFWLNLKPREPSTASC